MNQLVQDLNDTMCIDFNNSLLGGNFFSTTEAYYVELKISFNYSMFIRDFTSIDVDSFFPLFFWVYYPSSSLDPLNYIHPSSNGIGYYYTRLNFNKTKYFEISSQVIEITTDSSFILKSNQTQNVFTSNFRQISDEYYEKNSPLLWMNFYLDY